MSCFTFWALPGSPFQVKVSVFFLIILSHSRLSLYYQTNQLSSKLLPDPALYAQANLYKNRNKNANGTHNIHPSLHTGKRLYLKTFSIIIYARLIIRFASSSVLHRKQMYSSNSLLFSSAQLHLPNYTDSNLFPVVLLLKTYSKR